MVRRPGAGVRTLALHSREGSRGQNPLVVLRAFLACQNQPLINGETNPRSCGRDQTRT